MTSYENAPATKMLATHCAVCSRPLVDAKSVELGIGPDCRKKYGFDMACTDEQRTYANRLVYQIALGRLSFNDFKDAIAALNGLGFTKLAEIIVMRKSAISVTAAGEGFILADLPYNENALGDLRRIGRATRNSKGKFAGWQVAANLRNTLFALMKKHYPGTIGIGPRGLFEVPHRID